MIGNDAIIKLAEYKYNEAIELLISANERFEVVMDEDKDLIDSYSRYAMDIYCFRKSNRLVDKNTRNEYQQEANNVKDMKLELMVALNELLDWFTSIRGLQAPDRIFRGFSHPKSKEGLYFKIVQEISNIDRSDLFFTDLTYISDLTLDYYNYIHVFKEFSKFGLLNKRIKRGMYHKYIKLLMDDSKYTRVNDCINNFREYQIDFDKRNMIEERINEQKKFLKHVKSGLNKAMSKYN